jgi:pimeloyl-ACP methyl ester carboxylesterase
VPALASALPHALDEAAAGRFTPLVGLAMAMQGGSRGLFTGMHFSVVCAEDYPLLDRSDETASADFSTTFADLYRQVCAQWPRGDVPAAFYTVPAAPVPVLLLSGSLDPVTPPRHGERVARALGPQARHGVVSNAGHGVLALACVRDAMVRFVNAQDPAAAAVAGASVTSSSVSSATGSAGTPQDPPALPAACSQLPRPPAYAPPGTPRDAGAGTTR